MRGKADVRQLDEEEINLIDDFAPSFVYPIFGQEELIFGYTGLEIQVRRCVAPSSSNARSETTELIPFFPVGI